MQQTKSKIGFFEIGIELSKIGQEAVRQVKNENRELGIPLVFSKNGEIFYELPDGSITTTSPFAKN